MDQVQDQERVMDLNEFMSSEELHIKHLDDLVKKSIEDEEILTSKLAELEGDEYASLSQKWADSVASFGGSWMFIGSFFLLIVFWILLNVYGFGRLQFDPYPFIFLNLVLSCIAALQAPVIMMSQNRQDEKDRRRSRADYMVNLKSEMEIRNLHSKVDVLISEEMKTLFQIQKKQMELLVQIQEQLSKKSLQ